MNEKIDFAELGPLKGEFYVDLAELAQLMKKLKPEEVITSIESFKALPVRSLFRIGETLFCKLNDIFVVEVKIKDSTLATGKAKNIADLI